MTTQSTPPDSSPPESTPQPASGGGRSFLRRNILLLGGGGVIAVVIIAVVAVVFATGMIGGGGGQKAATDFILRDSSSVAVIEVASILTSLEIPAQLASFSSLGLPGINPDDPDEWKDAWRNKWENDFPQIQGSISLDEVTTAVLQRDDAGKALGWVFIGEFAFADIRDDLEVAGSKSDTYRDFEVWDDDVALLEDRGVLVIGSFTFDLLESLDTDKGFADEASALMQALDKAGAGLVVSVVTDCNSNFFQAQLNGCDALAEVVTGGDANNTQVSGFYVFSNESRAGSGSDDIEEAIEEQDTYDADLIKIETRGEIVSYEAAIIGGFVGGGTGEGSNPQALILEDADHVIVQNVAAILQTEFPDGIPQQMLRFKVFKMPTNVDLEDALDWKQEWNDVFADDLPYMLNEAITLEEVTYVMQQWRLGGFDGVVISGNFDFEAIREVLEDDKYGPGLKDGEYRKFEVWGDNEIALLEDRGLIVYSRGFVQEFLKALDRGGFVDDESDLKRALDRIGDALVLRGDASCSTGHFFPTSDINRCESLVYAVQGGDVSQSKVSGVYVFRNENSAESGQDDVEDAIEDQTSYDVDLDEIETSGDFVTYKVTIHQDYEAPGPEETPVPAPTEALEPEDPRNMSPVQIARAIIECGIENNFYDARQFVEDYGSLENAAQEWAALYAYDDLVDEYGNVCGY